MNLRIKISFFVLMFVLFYGFSGKGPNDSDNFRKHENKAFKEGEKLVFDLNYGFITAGGCNVYSPDKKNIR